MRNLKQYPDEKKQGWGRKFTVKPYGSSYSYADLVWFGTFYKLPRLGWYWASQFLSQGENK